MIALLNSDVVSAELTGEVAYPKQIRLNMAPRGFVISHSLQVTLMLV